MRPSRAIPTSYLAYLCVLFTLYTGSARAQSTSTVKRSCTVDDRQADSGEKALAKEDYLAAETFYRAAVQASPTSPGAHLGLVRSLIGEDKVDEAREEAGKIAATDVLSDVALAEVAYRAADLDTTESHVLAAMQKDSCDGRTLTIAARLVELSAMHARAARYLGIAHQLRPNDELIRRDWIHSLPTQQRQQELEKYLDGTVSLSGASKRDFDNEEQMLKARSQHVCTISSTQGHVRMPFTAVLGSSVYERESYGLDVQLNGQHRNMEIDTGASGIVLTPSAAKKLHLTPEYSLRTSGVGSDGDVDSFLTHVAKIQIGDVTLSDCMVEVLQKADMYADGLIGLDVFSRWITTMDYKKREIRLDPLPERPGDSPKQDETPQDRYIAPDMEKWVHILRLGHMILLPAQFNNGRTHFVVADTGSSMTFLSLSTARDGIKMHPLYDVRIQGLSGYVKNVYGVFGRLQVGGWTVPFTPTPTPTGVIAYDMTSLSHHAGFEIGGLLGAQQLQLLMISLDYRDNLVQLKYNPIFKP